jgi:predicted nucleotidyltransferase
MKIIGIVVEYNPFHNGHLYQIKKIKEMYKDSIIIVVSSSSFTQRGELSIINKFDKTKIAIDNGIDLFIELPYAYSTQSSDIFAHYALKILNNFKLDYLCFGTESDNLEEITQCAKTQINNKEFDLLVKKYMDEGINYPTALNKALNDLTNYEIKDANDLLALSYIKEIYKNNYNIELFNIKRTNDYHDIESNNDIVSSSNIRYKISQNKDFKDNVPLNVYNLLKDKKIHSKYFEYLKYKIVSENDLNKYLDVDEGLSTRIKKAIKESNTLEELIQNIKTKRYTYNRIYRMLNHILCSFTKIENSQIKDIEYLRILGFSKKGQEYLNSIKKDINIPILNKYDTDKYKVLNIEKRVSNIYSIIYENILDEEIKNRPYKKSE